MKKTLYFICLTFFCLTTLNTYSKPQTTLTIKNDTNFIVNITCSPAAAFQGCNKTKIQPRSIFSNIIFDNTHQNISVTTSWQDGIKKCTMSSSYGFGTFDSPVTLMGNCHLGKHSKPNKGLIILGPRH